MQKTFLFSRQGEDSSDIKLDFVFDAELAKLTEEKPDMTGTSGGNKDLEMAGDPPKPIPMPDTSGATSNVNDVLQQCPTSPAQEVHLNFKIASVKNVWEDYMPSYEPR